MTPTTSTTSSCVEEGTEVFVYANMPGPNPTTLLLVIAEPTRLRIVNCLAAAPLFVSELQQILDLPQPTVSRHLTVLRNAGIVRDTQVGQFVLYRLIRPGRHERLLNAILDGLASEEPMKLERHRALDRSRTRGTERPVPRMASRES